LPSHDNAITCFVKKLLELSMVIGIELIDDRTNHVDGECIACIKENIIPKRFNIENPKRLYRIFFDIYRPFDIEGYF